jgi:hydrogenase 3 maturation protease
VKNLKAALKSKFKNAKKIALIGIGSELRGDDIAGILVAKKLKKYKEIHKEQKLKVFIGSTAPENITGEIKRFKPTHIVIVDSADLGKCAGEAALIDLNAETGVSFSTHRLATKIIANYLSKSLNCEIMIIGIQPKMLDFAELPSKEIEESSTLISGIIKEIVCSN